MSGKIGVFDSGIGGLSIVSELRHELPDEDILFYEDSINNPYGKRSEEELLKITSNIVDYLLDNDCKIIVIACNTATVSCMKKLRNLYPEVIFVGTVPAIKVACDNNYKNIVVLSTPNTVKSNRVQELINDYRKEDQNIINVSGDELASYIEKGDVAKIKDLLHSKLDVYKDKIDALVLGCTHYSLIKDIFDEILPGVILIDGSNGVAREVKHQLMQNNLLDTASGKLLIFNSEDEEIARKSYEILDNL